MATYLLPGGTGFMGKALSRHFVEQGHEVIVLTRSSRVSTNRITYLQWDGKTRGPWTQAMDLADVVINLAGRSVNCRYTKENKQEIFDSRVDSTRILGEAIADSQNPPSIWMNSSTATIYRHAEDRPMTESSGELGSGMSVNVARAWEDSFFGAQTPGIRKVALRTSIVLSTEDGAFTRLLNLARTGAGGAQGGGQQMVSWIHVEDVIRAIEFLIDRSDLEGPFNLAAPDPIPNHKFMKILREAVGMPFGMPMPGWLMEIGAAVIGTETELILKSRWVLPERLLKEGFEFRYGTAQKAIGELVG